MDSLSIAAIVPAYNEEKTIKEVVRVLRASRRFKEVIVVSDGSTDNTDAFALEEGARVIHVSPNQGKGEAMLKGVASTDCPFIAFFDADLIGLQVQHVEDLLEAYPKDQRMMRVGFIDRGSVANYCSVFFPWISGERVMPRELIESIEPAFLHRFMVESSLNYGARILGITRSRVVLRGLGIRRKIEKVGVVSGVAQYAKMIKQILQSLITVRIAHVRGTFLKK
jgi:glycosyltransferase involved in cell wall biosynthesis